MTRLWIDYTSVFGLGNTVGFSTISGASSLSNMAAIYSGSIPYTFDIHDYGTGYTGSFNQLAYNNFVSTYDAIKQALGYVPGWYIGETFLDDPPTAAALRQAASDTSQTVWFVLQWGVSAPNNVCLGQKGNNYGNVGILDGTDPQTSYGTNRGLTEWGQYW